MHGDFRQDAVPAEKRVFRHEAVPEEKRGFPLEYAELKNPY